MMLLTLNNTEDWNQEKFESLEIPEGTKTIIIAGGDGDPISYKHFNKLWVVLKNKVPGLKLHIKTHGTIINNDVIGYCDSGTFIIPSLKDQIWEPAKNINLKRLHDTIGNRPWIIEIPILKGNTQNDDIIRTIRLCMSEGFQKFILVDKDDLGDPFEDTELSKNGIRIKNGRKYNILGSDIVYMKVGKS